MRFQRLTALLLIAVPCVLCCACGGDDTDGGNSTVSGTPDASNVGDASSEAASEEETADATLTIKVKKGDIVKHKNNRPYDKSKEDISLILIVGQSNFTTNVGFSSELGGVLDGKIAQYSEEPILPTQGICYSSGYRTAITALTPDRDMSKLCNTSKMTNTLGGISPSFGIKWNELTGTKVVFVQAAVGAVGVHEWTPNPDDYICECNENAALYQRTVDIYKQSFDALSKDYNIVYAGYLWNQGEHEEQFGKPGCVSTVSSDASYYAAYKSMHDGFMEELGLDFGGISVVRADKAGGTAQGSMCLTTARNAQYRLCNDIDNLFMVSTISETCAASAPLDMDKTNTIHYSQTTFNKMGPDCATNLYNCLGLSEKPVEFAGVQVYSSAGIKIAEFDKDGKAMGETVVAKGYLSDHILTKNTVLGTNYSIEGYTFTAADGTDLSAFVDEYGLFDWMSIATSKVVKSVKIKCVIE